MRPAPVDAVDARRILLAGLAEDADLGEVLGRLEPLHPCDDTFPAEVLVTRLGGAVRRFGG
jgi:hypothetical protein